MRRVARAAVGVAAVGVAGVAYSAGYEVRAFRLRRVEIPCLPSGSTPIKVLHLSDIHMMPGQRKKQAWLRGLAALEPDLVVNTGDNLSHPDAVPTVLAALGDLLDLPGAFVLGSNDYWGPVVKSPVRYLLPNGGGQLDTGPPLPWRSLRAGLSGAGWADLTNARAELKVGSAVLAFAGVDDPHLRYDELAAVEGPADPLADLRIGVTHAPYLRVLDAFTRDGYDAIFAGHTHGGQIRLPGYGALVTNCDIEPARARGLHHHQAAGRLAWLHVSAGCGTSPYAPYRFCCYPEATLATLTAGPAKAGDRTLVPTAPGGADPTG
jgi:predicted MPP superfamily phosphohydrolase